MAYAASTALPVSASRPSSFPGPVPVSISHRHLRNGSPSSHSRAARPPSASWCERHLDAGEDRLEGLRRIGIDELSYRRHHQHVTVVIDHERGVVVWSQRRKSANTLKAFFKELGPERCKMIESATIDMSGAYISAAKEMIPDATLVFDRFHVQRLVQNALDKVREAPNADAKNP